MLPKLAGFQYLRSQLLNLTPHHNLWLGWFNKCRSFRDSLFKKRLKQVSYSSEQQNTPRLIKLRHGFQEPASLPSVASGGVTSTWNWSSSSLHYSALTRLHLQIRNQNRIARKSKFGRMWPRVPDPEILGSHGVCLGSGPLLKFVRCLLLKLTS